MNDETKMAQAKQQTLSDGSRVWNVSLYEGPELVAVIGADNREAAERIAAAINDGAAFLHGV